MVIVYTHSLKPVAQDTAPINGNVWREPDFDEEASSERPLHFAC